MKNDETGQWEKRPFYTVDDAFPFGHGEKSVYLIERFMRLKPVEAMAIRWHMGGFDDAAKLMRRPAAAALPSAWHLTAIRSP